MSNEIKDNFKLAHSLYVAHIPSDMLEHVKKKLGEVENQWLNSMRVRAGFPAHYGGQQLHVMVFPHQEDTPEAMLGRAIALLDILLLPVVSKLHR